MTGLLACEQEILAFLLARPDSYFDVADRLLPEMFADPVCRAIYQGIVTTRREGGWSLALVDANAVGAPEDLDLVVRLHALVARGQAAEAIPLSDLAAPLFDRALRQKMLAEQERLAGALRAGKRPAAALLQEAKETLRTLEALGTPEPATQSLAEAGERVYARAIEAREGGRPFGLKTGLFALDRALDGGFANGDLVILAGFPAGGKTTLAMQIAEKAALDGRSVLFAQAEMSAEQMAVRRLSALTEVPINRIRQGACSREDEEKIVLWQQQWRRLSFEIQSGQLNVEDVHRVARVHKAQRPNGRGTGNRAGNGPGHENAPKNENARGLDLLVLDSAKRIGTSSRAARAPHEIASAVYQQAKSIAVDLEVPVIILGHPKDSVTQGTAADYRLKMTDIYTGGNGEGIADTFLIMRRPEPRLNALKGEGTAEENMAVEMLLERWRGQVEIFIDKNRNGSGQQRVDLRFDASRNQFMDAVDAEEDSAGEAAFGLDF